MKITSIRNAALIAAVLATATIASAQVPNTTKPGEATTMKMGQANPPDKSPLTSDTTRAEVKSEAIAAEHTNKGTSMGNASSGTGRDEAHKPTAKHNGMRKQKHAEGKAAAHMTNPAAQTAN